VHTLTRHLRAAAALLASCAAACSGSETTGPISNNASVASVTLVPGSAAFPTGGFVQFDVILRDASGNKLSGWPVTWSSSNTAVATVGGSGMVTGLTNGASTITATSDGKTATASITVKPTVLGKVTAIAASVSNACALNSGGDAFCWGFGPLGAIGDGSVTTRSTPTLVSGGLTYSAISTSTTHACGISTGGVGYCWGTEIGVGDRALLNGARTSPVPLSLTGMTAVGVGWLHTCALVSSGAAYCWGEGPQLGNGTADRSRAAVAVSGGRTYKSLAVAAQHACALTTSGAAFCWGNNFAGQLGDGTTTSGNLLPNVPVEVKGNLVFTSLTAGEKATCGLIAGGAAYCWGGNESGQLGDATTTQRLQPVPVAGGLSFTSLAAGVLHACGLRVGGAMYCWGDNTNGALGDGTFTSSSVPVAVVGGLSFSSVAAGDSFTCGLTTAGAVYCWGNNNRGQLGNGTANKSNVPVQIAAQQ